MTRSLNDCSIVSLILNKQTALGILSETDVGVDNNSSENDKLI